VDVRLLSHAGTHTVRLTPEGDGFATEVDGAAHRIARVSAGPRTAAAGGATVEELAFELDGRWCRAVVARTRARVLVSIAGRVYGFESGDAAGRTGIGGAASGTIVAPMPGKVISLLVAVGDAVEAGTPVVVLEAMKMETTLTAEVAGTVARVSAAPGALVDAGDVLVDIEAAPGA
jgi:3-methylcrotonyl-CoA carboxylase alpha subunit